MLKFQINCRLKGKPFAPIGQINFVVDVVSLSVVFSFSFFHFFALNASVS